MGSPIAVIIFRLAVAGGALAAMGYQLFAIHIPRGYNPLNFFSYFTNLANLLLAAVFIVSAIHIARRKQTLPSRTGTAIRGAAVVYIAFVGLVFNTLLRDADLSAIDPTVNVILHLVTPAAGVIDWILQPPHTRIPWKVILLWMVFPAAYAIFSVARGSIDGIYPYPFFNPGAVGGYGAVTLYCLVMVIAFVILSIIIRALGNRRQTPQTPRSSA